MKKNFGPKTWFFPLPVLVIASYDASGEPNAMTAAWGGIVDYNMVELNLDPSHKSAQNIMDSRAFTISFADEANIAAADYFGIVSGHKENKALKSGLTFEKSEFVNAPIIKEFPITLECEAVKLEYVPDGVRIVGEIKNVCAEESVLTDGKIDLSLFKPMVFDTVNNKYVGLSDKTYDAFSIGKKLK